MIKRRFLKCMVMLMGVFTFFVFSASDLMAISRDPAGPRDGPNLYAGHFAARMALDPSGTTWIGNAKPTYVDRWKDPNDTKMGVTRADMNHIKECYCVETNKWKPKKFVVNMWADIFIRRKAYDKWKVIDTATGNQIFPKSPKDLDWSKMHLEPDTTSEFNLSDKYMNYIYKHEMKHYNAFKKWHDDNVPAVERQGLNSGPYESEEACLKALEKFYKDIRRKGVAFSKEEGGHKTEQWENAEDQPPRRPRAGGDDERTDGNIPRNPDEDSRPGASNPDVIR